MHFFVPAQQLHQLLDPADHVPQLGYVVVALLPGERSYEIAVDEDTGNGAANSSCQAGKGLHLKEGNPEEQRDTVTWLRGTEGMNSLTAHQDFVSAYQILPLWAKLPQI